MLCLSKIENIKGYLGEKEYKKINPLPIIKEDFSFTFSGTEAYYQELILDEKVKGYTIQTTLRAIDMDDMGLYPLASPLIYGLYLYSNNLTLKDFFKDIKCILQEYSIEYQDLYIITDNNDTELFEILGEFFKKGNIIEFPIERLYYKVENEVKGKYIKLILKYKHGIVPIIDIAIMKDRLLRLDTIIYLERLDFIYKGLSSVFDYESIINIEFNKENNYQIYNIDLVIKRLIINTRALIVMIHHEIISGPNKVNHVFKKFVKKTLELAFLFDVDFKEIVEIIEKNYYFIRESLEYIEVEFNKDFAYKEILLTVFKEEKDKFNTNLQKIKKYIFNQSNIDYEFINSTFGISKNVINKILNENINIYPDLFIENRFKFKYAAYPFAGKSDVISNPKEWLLSNL